MKKLFLIPLMACFCCVMAWAAEVEVATYAELRSAVAAANNGDVIKITDDMTIRTTTSNTVVNVLKSITIDGQGHSITGYACRGTNTSNGTLIAINHNGSTSVDVVIKDLSLVTEKLRAIETRGNIQSLTIDNCTIEAKQAAAWDQPITIGGNQSTVADVIIKNSTIKAAKYYPIVVFNPVNMTITDSKFQGWSSVYFKGVNSSEGSHGSTLTATNTYFDAQNIYTGSSDDFGAFPLEDDGINIVLDNCVVNVTAHHPDKVQQSVFLLSSWSNRQEEACSIKIKGANSHIIGQFIDITWDNVPQDIAFTLEGGSYYGADYLTAMEDTHVSIATGFHAEQVSQGGQVLYRIVKDAAEKTPGVKYDLNDDVPTDVAGEGNNPSTSFELSTGDDMTLNNEVTTAGYVQIKDNATEGATTVTVGQTAGGDDQTLVINDGLDVQGESQVIVEPGATLQIGEGGIVTAQPSNIVIEADENGAASMIMDPAITVNTTPNLTVKMKAKAIGWMNMLGEKQYFWHRFALPIQECTTWVKYPNKSTYVFGWNYSANNWEQLSALTQMVPFKGYTLSADYENLGDVEYTFTGQLAGNQNNALQFERNGFNFFGNSYTGYIDVLALVDQIMGDNKIDGTVWMWYQDQQSYVAIPLQSLRNDPTAFDSWMREVAPMQTFILKQNGAENATTELNYASAVWGNPRYGNNSGSGAGAPRRAEADETTRMRIIVTAENGKSDFVMFTEDGKFTDAFEKGYDGEKYMNENALNMYTTVEGANYSAVATDNLEGKMMTIKTVEAVNYTMSFAKVNGEAYAIRDNVTNQVIAITEGATYEFAAQPNSLVENRFEIVSIAKVPTAIENTDVKANAKGIYSITGQYLGEDFNALPAGIYVVNGVKIVK